MGMGDWGMDGAICAGALPLQPASSFESDGYVISGFTAADAADIPRAFTAVYGHDYLSSVVYDPAAFAALVAGGAQISFIARGSEERRVGKECFGTWSSRGAPS